MIPLKLTIEGLYSYRERQEIDFTNLTRAGLFGIFGGVGSGKSSILEAMSFALYGKSQRLNATGDNRSYNMMNLKSDRLFIDFEFRTGPDQQYRFVVDGKRNSKKFDKVETFERSAYKRVNGMWEPIAVETVEQITQLNYENFHRTIIIPQGKFQEFMQLSPKDRTDMLEQLFDLSRFNLSDKVIRLESANNYKINNLEGEMKGIGSIQPGEIEELEEKKISQIAEFAKLKQDAEVIRKKDLEMDTLQKLTIEIQQKKQKLEKLLSTEEKIREVERRLKEFEKLERLFRADLFQLESGRKNLEKAKKEYESTSLQLKDLQLKNDKHLPVFEQIKNDYNKKDQLIRQQEEIENLVRVKELDNNLEQINIKVNTLRNNRDLLSNQVLNGKQTITAKTVEVNGLKKNLPDLKVINEVKNWFLRRKQLLTEINDSRKKIGQFEHEIKTIRNQMFSSINESGIFGRIEVEKTVEEYQEMINQAKSVREEALETIRAKKSLLEVQHKLEQYAASLHDGKPCPLCGSTEHPKVLDTTDVNADLLLIVQEEKACTGKLSTIRQNEQSISSGKEKIRIYSGQRVQEQAILAKLESGLDELSESFAWEGFDPSDEAKVENESIRYDQILKMVKEGERLAKDLDNKLLLDESNLEKARLELVNVEKQENEITTRIQALSEQLKSIEISHYQDYSIEALKNNVEKIREKHTRLVQDFEEAEKIHNELHNQINILNGKIITMESGLKSQEELMQSMTHNLDKKLIDCGLTNIEQVKQILALDTDVEKERERIELYFREVSALKTAISERDNELAGRTYDMPEHENLKLEVLRLKDLIEGMGKEIGKMEETLSNKKKDAERLASLQTEMDKAVLRKQDLDEMKSLFRSAGFVNYISSIYLQNLCKAANERFYRLTRQKLGLELAPDNSFLVRDYMNEGRLRSAKSLSGGQTFQASLSLALSLADSIHRNAGSAENFFFLDEGFGSLDRENLEIAFEALKSLRKENRIVGVISHVEEMQTEIETCLKITNDEEHGSVIRPSWVG